jgi:HEPN domain-containing protein
MQESFANSASRHLHDSQVLLKEERLDNAVYLAGYVVECAFKTLVEQYFKNNQAAYHFNHDIIKLEDEMMDRLRVMYPILDQQLPTSQTSITVLAKDHPNRRYAKSQLWSEDEAELAVKQAKKIYQDTILKLVLDGLISSQEI